MSHPLSRLLQGLSSLDDTGLDDEIARLRRDLVLAESARQLIAGARSVLLLPEPTPPEPAPPAPPAKAHEANGHAPPARAKRQPHQSPFMGRREAWLPDLVERIAAHLKAGGSGRTEDMLAALGCTTWQYRLASKDARFEREHARAPLRLCSSDAPTSAPTAVPDKVPGVEQPVETWLPDLIEKVEKVLREKGPLSKDALRLLCRCSMNRLPHALADQRFARTEDGRWRLAAAPAPKAPPAASAPAGKLYPGGRTAGEVLLAAACLLAEDGPSPLSELAGELSVTGADLLPLLQGSEWFYFDDDKSEWEVTAEGRVAGEEANAS